MLFFFFVSLISPMAWAETVLVPAPTASTREYQARLISSAYISPTQSYLNTHPSLAAREDLLGAYAEAQKAFLEQSLTQAQAGFENVVKKVGAEDWGATEREVFLLSYLRLAQIDGGRRDEWLARAIQLGPDVKAEKSLFPPPLFAQLERLRKESPKMNPGALYDSTEWTRILVNGNSCSRHACAEMPNLPGTVRVTFLSDRWLPQTLFMSLSDLPKAAPERIAWLQGSCGSPVFHAKSQKLGTKSAFWSLNCDQPGLPASSGLNLQPVARAPGPDALVLPEPMKEQRTPFYKNKWVWAGVGVVAAVVIASSLSKKKASEEERVTTTSYGY